MRLVWRETPEGDVTEGESGGWEDGGASVNNMMVVVEAVMHCSRDSTAGVRSGVSRISADITVGKAGGGGKKNRNIFLSTASRAEPSHRRTARHVFLFSSSAP